MKRKLISLFICTLTLSIACSQNKKFPAPVGYVNDFDHVFSVQERKSLDSLITAFEKETTVEIAVLTLDNTYCGIENFDSLVLSIHNEWGVGKEDKNNGVLIAICKQSRKMRINNGSGIEIKMTDEETRQILNKEIFPEFRQDKYYEGVRKGIISIMKELR